MDQVIVFFQLLLLFSLFVAKTVDMYFQLPLFEVLDVIRWVALGLVAFSVLFMTLGALKLGKFGRIRPRPARNSLLRTTGPFAYSRHPMYSAMVLGSFAWAVYLGSYFALAASVLLVLVLIWKAQKEESYLLKMHGDDYRKYMRKVARFSPRFWSKKSKVKAKG